MTRKHPPLHRPLTALPFLHAGTIRARAPWAMPQGVMRKNGEIDDPGMRALRVGLAIGAVVGDPERHRRDSHSG